MLMVEQAGGQIYSLPTNSEERQLFLAKFKPGAANST